MKMTTEHPRWGEFCERLGGPEGCDFKKDKKGEIHWKCAGGRDKSLATKILRKMGLTLREVAESFAYFEEHGGYCDCEILFNVDREDEADEEPVN